MAKGGYHSQAVRTYFRTTREFAIVVAARFKAVYPKYYAKYEEDFMAGHWLSSEEDSGPFLGRAIVYKLQSHCHRDPLDSGPSVTVPAGYFKGGAIYFPDLEAKFAYRSGDICIALSADLYHEVEEWEPIPSPPEHRDHGVTPGRIATVFFHPKKSSLTLLGKGRDWATRSAGGIVVDPVYCHARNPAISLKKGKRRAKNELEKATRQEKKEVKRQKRMSAA
ncbi:hypothetical protein C8R43DRAFT_888284 [Mycena crocata]|nr:hypothetical protein C8R43DRAFT_888284 [Mycena crocata]